MSEDRKPKFTPENMGWNDWPKSEFSGQKAVLLYENGSVTHTWMGMGIEEVLRSPTPPELIMRWKFVGKGRSEDELEHTKEEWLKHYPEISESFINALDHSVSVGRLIEVIVTDKEFDLQEEIHRIKRTIEMNKLSIEGNKSKINLLAKEYEELCEKKRLYEENREAIENLGALKKEQTTLLSTVKSKDALFKKCQDRITKILVEQGSTQTTLESLQESRKELEEVEREWIAYDLFQQCMHANGIPYQIIKQKLPLLNGSKPVGK